MVRSTFIFALCVGGTINFNYKLYALLFNSEVFLLSQFIEIVSPELHHFSPFA